MPAAPTSQKNQLIVVDEPLSSLRIDPKEVLQPSESLAM
ncbi:hypothetical protein SynBIOSE41_04412 [Synechococcus sp. BIOS-E4-1]|nr:hypothetical protein SynBIOSE41_04412 [Synechococcus sp. BIOS-E4-1]